MPVKPKSKKKLPGPFNNDWPAQPKPKLLKPKSNLVRITKRRRATQRQMKMRRLGLVEPAPKLQPAQLLALQQEWYAKLAKEGFEDIEWTKSVDSHDHQLIQAGTSARHATPGREQYYALCTNYLTHAPAYAWRRYEKPAFRLHADGVSYAGIVKAMKAKGVNRSVFWWFHFIKRIKTKMLKWNREHPEGLLNAANADSWATDALLKDFHLLDDVEDPQ